MSTMPRCCQSHTLSALALTLTALSLCLALCAASTDSLSTAAPPHIDLAAHNVYDLVRQQILSSKTQPNAIQNMKTIIEKLHLDLTFQQNVSEHRYATVSAKYRRLILQGQDTVRQLRNDLIAARRREANVTYEIEELQADLGTLDARIKERSKIIGILEDKISAGEFERRHQHRRFVRRVNETKTSLQAVNFLIDQLGSNYPSLTLAQRLNDLYRNNETDANKTYSNFLEAEAEVHARAPQDDPPQRNTTDQLMFDAEPDDLDYLRDALGDSYHNLHQYLRFLTKEEGYRAFVWSQAKYIYQNRSLTLQGQIDLLERSRIPNKNKLTALKTEKAALTRTRFYTRGHVRKVQHRIERLTRALEGMAIRHTEDKSKREKQLETAVKLHRLVLRYLSTTPTHLPATTLPGELPLWQPR